VLSELTTNALVHAGSAATIVALLDDGRLRVKVNDEDRVPPRLRDRSDGSGGGLRVVAALIDGWLHALGEGRHAERPGDEDG